MTLSIPVGAQTLAVHVQGAGDPVVLLHSGGLSSRQWRKLTALLLPSYQVLVPDLLGYGASGPWPDGVPFHFRTDALAVAALIDTLPAAARVVGHSYGGLIALHLALLRPGRVRSLALYEPVAFGILDEPEDAAERASLELVQTPYERDPDAWLAGFVDWWNGPGSYAALPAEAQATWRAAGWKVSQEVLSLTADRTDRRGYGAIAVPTLLLGGERSPRTERRVLEKLAAALPKATLTVVAGAGHMGPITHADEVNRAIAAALV